MSKISDDAEAVASFLPLASVSQQPDVSELLSFTLDRLHKEPELLCLDAERIQRKLKQTLVANHSTLLDLLEIPQLIDTCVRNGNYENSYPWCKVDSVSDHPLVTKVYNWEQVEEKIASWIVS